MAWFNEEKEDPNDNQFFRTMETLTGKKIERHEKIVFHDGKSSPQELLELSDRSRRVFKEPITFIKHIIETLQTAKKRIEARTRAIKKIGERVEARYIKRKRENPDKKISSFISTNDLDINALLDKPDRIGQKIGFIHTDQLDWKGKLIKKEIKKKINRKKRTLKTAKKDNKILEIENLEADILALKIKIGKSKVK